MSEMVERVTHAVFDSINSEGSDYCALEVARQAAKAAIEAMREPTKAVLEAGDVNAHPLDRLDASEAWSKMIDEALK